MKKYFFIFLSICYGCSYDKKEDPKPEKKQEFNGVVLDYTTSVPVSGAEVVFYLRDKDTSNIFSGTLSLYPLYFNNTEWNQILSVGSDKYTTLSDVNGYYSIIEPFDDSEKDFSVVAYKPGYIFLARDLRSGGSVDYFSYQTSFLTDTLYVDLASVLKTNFHHTQTISNSDTLFLYCLYYAIQGNSNLYHGEINHKYVFASNAVITLNDSVSFKMNDHVKIEWSIYNNGLKAQDTINTSLLQFATKQVDIFY